MFRRRLGPVLAEQERRLGLAAAQLRKGGEVTLEEVVAALIEPTLNPPFDDPGQAERARRMFGAVLTDPSQSVVEFNAQAFGGIADVLHRSIRRLSAGYPPDVFHWLYTCAMGVSIFPQSFGARISALTGQPKRPPDWREVSALVVGFIVNGLRSYPPVRRGARRTRGEARPRPPRRR